MCEDHSPKPRLKARHLQSAPVKAKVYPMIKADLATPAAWAGAEVEGRHGKAFVIETQHVGPAGRPVFHVAYIRAIHKLHMAAPKGRRRSAIVRHWDTTMPQETKQAQFLSSS